MEKINQMIVSVKKINRYLKDLYDYNYQTQNISEKSDEEKKEFLASFQEYSKSFYSKNYGKVIEYARNRGLLKVDILSQADKLCSMVVDHLIKKINMSNDVDYETLKEVCEYIVKINNKNVSPDKTECLIESIYQKIETLGISFDSSVESKFSHKELLGIIAKIIAIKDVDLESINNLKIVKESEDSIYLRCNNYLIKVSSQLTNDRIRSFDNSLGDFEVNTVLPNIKLNYAKGCTIGDSIQKEEIIDSNRLFCQVNNVKEIQK